MNKRIALDKVSNLIKDNMTIMVGGFLGIGTPEKIIDFLVEKNVQNLTLICNDTAFPDKGTGKLILNKQIKKVIVSHIGTNPVTGEQMINKELEVELIPQGTLAEKIRCGGTGLGGVLTPTGVGTEVAKGKKIIVINEKEFLLETPLHADVAIIFASKADEKGNLVYDASTRNFNPLMAMAADTVIVETKEIVKVGDLHYDHIVTPHILVDYIVKGE
ncbi:CoA transferase subunit A [Anaerotignum sp.]|uniref:CoA transferase subunit A n=1 Tax=Anaerotignum sp. TaxID=2039241 RepID=UPI0028A59213|nr:3-oxoacid CoA-transferase subunit A [Anaerotignum sp.]